MAKCFDAIDLDSIKLAPAKVSKAAAGCKTAKITGVGGKPVHIQTPPMTIPWKIEPRKMDDTSGVNANLSLSFLGMEEDADNDLHNFMNFMRDFDIKIKTLLAATGGAVGKKSEEKVLDANFKDSIKEASNGNYPSTIQPKVWLSLRDGGDPKSPEDYTMDIKVFDFNGKVLDSGALQKGCTSAAIIEPSYVWGSALGVGITWVAKQVAVKPNMEETFAFKLDEKFDHLKDQEPPTKKARDSPAEEEEENESQGSSRDPSEDQEEEVDF